MKTDKEIKAEVLAKVKPILKKKGLKGTLSFRDGRTMRLTLKVNEETAKWIYEGSVYSYYAHDYKSDIQTDYFDFGWLSEIKIVIV